MHCRPLFGALALLAGAVGLTAALAPQDKPKSAQPASAPTDDEMMAKFMEYGTPRAEHKVLDGKAGKWTYVMKWWKDAAATPEESNGTSELKWIMDGRYLTDETKGDTPFGPFEGRGTTGFDNMKKKYVSTWFDSMSTAIMMMEGTYDATTKTFTWRGEGPDPMAGKYMPMRMTDRMVDANKWVMEMFSTDHKSGNEFKSGEFTYTRAK